MRRRTLGMVFIVYGLLGLALIVVGAVVGLELAGRVERLAESADSTLASAAGATRAASDSFTNADTSLENAESSIRNAATLADEASATLDSLGSAMQISIFGAQPLASLADDFGRSAEQAEALAASLAVVGASLSETRTDVGAIGSEMEALADDLDELRDASGDDGSSPPVRLFIGLLLVWLAIPAVGAILAGLYLRRLPAEVVVIGASVRAAQDASQAQQRPGVEHDPDHEQGP